MEYKVIEAWTTEELEMKLNDYAKQGFVLKSHQTHKDGNLTNEKHFVIMERKTE